MKGNLELAVDERERVREHLRKLGVEEVSDADLDALMDISEEMSFSEVENIFAYMLG